MSKPAALRAEPMSLAALGRGAPYVLLAVIALGLGGLVPVYASFMGDSVGRLLLLPLALALAIVFLVDKFFLLSAILLIRSAGDVFFETTKVSVGPLSIGLGGLINLAVLLIVTVLIVESRKKDVFQGQRWWFAFIAVFAAGVLYSPNPGDAVKALLAVLSYFAVFLAAYFYVERTGDIRPCVRLVLFSSILPVLYALFDIAAHAGAIGDFRLKSTFTHPNIFAFYLVTVVSLLLYALKSPNFKLPNQLRWPAWAYLVLLLVLLLVTKTRSAWVACFAIFFIYALMFERRYLLYLCIAPFLALLIPSVSERLLDLAEGNELVRYAKLNSFAWRQLIWEDGLSWMEPIRYVAGYGVGGFKHYSPGFFSMSGGMEAGAHNVYVQMFFDLGVIGLFAYVMLLAGVARTVSRYAAIDRLGAFVLLAVAIQYVIISLSDNMLIYLAFNWYVWIILGAGVASVRHIQNRPEVAPPDGPAQVHPARTTHDGWVIE